jgi:hypothetical protein
LSIIDSVVFGIGSLPEAKIGPVKRMPKREMDSCGLHALLDPSSLALAKALDQVSQE